MIFKPELAEKILRGEKTATRRRMSNNERSPWWGGGSHYIVGQVFTINPGRGVKNIGKARVTAVYRQRLFDMGAADAWAEGFDSLLAFRNAWRSINGGFFNEEVWVVEFELLPESGEGDGR